MSGKGLSKIRKYSFFDTKDTVKRFRQGLKKNLFAVISSGSVASGQFRSSWSDVDVLIVVEKIDLKVKQIVAKIINKLEKDYSRHFGVNIISKEEFVDPSLPAISLDGKTLQTFIDLRLHPDRLLFYKEPKINFYKPTNKVIKDYSLSSIAMFLLRNRKSITKDIPQDFYEYKKSVSREIRASFILTKLAIQYFTLYNCTIYEDVILRAEKLFPNFDFEFLRKNIKIIDNWSRIKNKSQLSETFSKTDNYIERFTHYVFKQLSKKIE